MRTLAIGDIHGCRTALETLIAFVNPTGDDQLIFLGDYVNRGPDSRGVIDFLLKLGERRRCVFLRGNHEIMTMDARAEQTRASTLNPIGGHDLLRSYGFAGQSDWWNLIPSRHWRFFEQTARYFETNRHIFVHGWLDADLDLAEQPDWIFWERFETINSPARESFAATLHRAMVRLRMSVTPHASTPARSWAAGSLVSTSRPAVTGRRTKKAPHAPANFQIGSRKNKRRAGTLRASV